MIGAIIVGCIGYGLALLLTALGALGLCEAHRSAEDKGPMALTSLFFLAAALFVACITRTVSGV